LHNFKKRCIGGGAKMNLLYLLLMQNSSKSIIERVSDILPKNLDDFDVSHEEEFKELVFLSNDDISVELVTPARNPVIP